ncbi:MAG TPA: universal stress protein [Gemmatimonadales bacterium]|nr:universal stress protein [Gemmatimonadales bacterium]
MQVRRVLSAISMQSLGPRAALAGAEIAALAHAELVVLTVLRDPWEVLRPDEIEGLRRLHIGSPASIAAERASKQLADLVRPAVLSAPSVTYRVAFGLPSVEIARSTEETGADLIVIGCGDEVVQRGQESVTAATLRRSRVPVLVAPLRHRVCRRILACVDDSPNATAVLDAALALGEYQGAHVVALHVEPSPAGPAAPGGASWLRRLDGARESHGTAVAECETVVRQGDPATEILAQAADDTDLIVFGYRRGLRYGNTGAIGTVAVRLLRRAECALLAVPV